MSAMRGLLRAWLLHRKVFLMILLMIFAWPGCVLFRQLTDTEFEKIERRAYGGDLGAQKQLAWAYLWGEKPRIPISRAHAYAWYSIVKVKDPNYALSVIFNNEFHVPP